MQDIVYLFISSLWISLAIFYVTRMSLYSPKQTAVNLSFSLFFISAFMTQIETILLGNVYVSLEVIDIFSLIIGNAIPVIVAVFLGIKLFGNDFRPSKYSRKPKKFTVTEVIVKLLLAGLAYLVIYFVFGYFIFWRIGATHIFYSGDNHTTGFIAKIIETWSATPQVYLIEFSRGLLYGLFALPVINLFRKKSLAMLISLALILEMPVIYLIIPDFLFPDTIRLGHLWQMASTMFIFALTTWFIFDKVSVSKQS
jgi:hypothetical protein